MRGESKQERDLEKKGYRFSGFYTEDHQKALDRAAEHRKQGLFARVATKTYEGRCYNTVGYSVYIKDKEKAAQA